MRLTSLPRLPSSLSHHPHTPNSKPHHRVLPIQHILIVSVRGRVRAWHKRALTHILKKSVPWYMYRVSHCPAFSEFCVRFSLVCLD
jgi:hypothetical protein